MKTIAERLVFLRTRQGFKWARDFYLASQPNFDASGISEGLMRQFESGTKQPTWNLSFELTKAYGGSTQWLFSGEGPIDQQP